jgi:proteasome lid subunit RPN8/RPN11
LDDVICHAVEMAPVECCGLLLGHRNRIEKVIRTRNALDSPTRFLIHVEDHFAAVRLAREQAIEILGAYHSHPASPAMPSATDLAEANDESLVHVIVSVAGGVAHPDVRAFRLYRGSFDEVDLMIEHARATEP